ncbi:MAG: hypothetical protein ACP59X_09775 [Solidesulfovibrio sp. DCME]|uniref:hypothetical protein n=1 Tax=Solidesulfovibrio sp. DCME TaxID=3447380 RepID=UPI003D0A7136
MPTKIFCFCSARIYVFLFLLMLVSCSQQNKEIAELVTLDEADTRAVFVLSGLYPTEGSTSDRWRWGIGDSSRLYFYMDNPGPVIISGAFENPHLRQSMIFTLNGQSLLTLSDLPKNENKSAPLVFSIEGNAIQGRNILEISYSHWTGQEGSSSTDTRRFAVKYRNFTISMK